MGIWTPPPGQLVPVVGSVQGSDLTASGTANTKGSWVSPWFTTNSSHPMIGMIINMASFQNSASCRFLIDIALGGTSNIVAENIPYGYVNANSRGESTEFFLPISAPPGTAVYARCQSSISSGVIQVRAVPWYGSQWERRIGGIAKIVNLCANTGSTRGIELDPGTSAWTWPSSWTQLKASTATEYRALGIYAMKHGALSNDSQWDLRVAVGGSGSEETLIPQGGGHFKVGGDSFQDWISGGYGPIPTMLPSASRVSAMARTGITGADRVIDIHVLGYR